MGKLIIKNRFATVPNDLVNSKYISLKAKGLFAYIQSKPDGWDFSAERIAQQLKEGLPSIMSTLKELEQFGYLKRERYMAENGHRLVQYTLFDEPSSDNPNEGNLHIDFPSEENAYIVKPSEYIKTLIINQKKKKRNFRIFLATKSLKHGGMRFLIYGLNTRQKKNRNTRNRVKVLYTKFGQIQAMMNWRI
jgi:hypothetical protein